MKRVLLTAMALFLSSSPLAKPAGAAGDDEPVDVTSDSVAYCSTLGARLVGPAPSRAGTDTYVAARPVRALSPGKDAEIERLRSEGLVMCSQGHVRGGIMRLRRALMLLHGSTEDQP